MPTTTYNLDENQSITYNSDESTFTYRTIWDGQGLTYGTFYNGFKAVFGNQEANWMTVDTVIIEGYTRMSILAVGRDSVPMTINKVKIGESVKRIEEDCFKHFSGDSITLIGTSKLEYIGQSAFQNTLITHFTIPQTVIHIGMHAFSGTKLESITFEDGMNLANPNSASGVGSFEATVISSVTIPNSFSLIPKGFFKNMPNLLKVTFAENSTCTHLHDGAFMKCSNLQVINIPNTLQELGNDCFNGCSRLESIIFPNTVTTIRDGCLQGCSALTSVTLPENDNYTVIFPNMFTGCTALRSIILPANVIKSKFSSFNNCTNLAEIVINHTGMFTDLVFDVNTPQLIHIFIPNTVAKLNAKDIPTFNTEYSWTDNQKVMFHDIADVAYNSNYYGWFGSPNDVYISKRWTSISADAFTGKDNLTQITFERGSLVESIGDNAFKGTSITVIDIIPTVTSIGSDAFIDSKLETAYITETFRTNSSLSYGSNQSFFGKNESVNIRDGDNYAYTNEYYIQDGSPTTLVLSSRWTSIGDSAFKDTGLTDLELQPFVEDIATNAFEDSALNILYIYEYTRGNLTNIFFNVPVKQSVGNKEVFVRDLTINKYTREYYQQDGSPVNMIFEDRWLEIDSFAFGETDLASITFNSTSKCVNIGQGAFYKTNLTSIIFPPSIKALQGGIFGLTNVSNIEFSEGTTGAIINGAWYTTYTNNETDLVITCPSTMTAPFSMNTKTKSLTVILPYVNSLGVDSPSVIPFGGRDVVNFILPLPNLAICFPADTPVETDQGNISIDKLNTSKHTIRGNKIIAVTQSRPLQKTIVCIKKNALGNNTPSTDTEISRNHKVLYNGKMTKAKELVDVCKDVAFIDYNGKPLYNILMEKPNVMSINNLLCETLSPKNILAKLYNIEDPSERSIQVSKLNEIIKGNNPKTYKQFYESM